MKKINSILIFCFFLFIHVIEAQTLSSEFETIKTANDMMGGSLVVFCEDGILESHYVGTSDYTRNIPMTEDTKYRIASVSKTVTAIAVMQLVEQNLLNLDDDVSSILGYAVQNPNYPSTGITVRMLLSHTSTIIDGPTYSSFLGATYNNNPIPNLSEILTPSGSFYSSSQFKLSMV